MLHGVHLVSTGFEHVTFVVIDTDCDHDQAIINSLNDYGTLYRVITCSLGYLFDVTCLDDTTVAVSTNNGIKIIHIDSTTSESYIKTSKPCRGIAHHNGVLLWCEYQIGIQMMKLSDDRVSTLVKQDSLPYISYLSTCGDKINQANRDTCTVTCYTIKGETLWEYKDVSMLKDPICITMDNNYNIYVTSYNVVVLEPEGRQGRQLIRNDDGLKDLTGIYFDKCKNSLLVINCHGLGFLYQMS